MRESFGRYDYTHKTHEKVAEGYATSNSARSCCPD
ncbi:hypothetical protein [Bradyrhizobium sp. USDA 4503]